MKKQSLILAFASILFFVSSASAITTTIVDGYHGGDMSDGSTNVDVIGPDSAYNIEKMVVNVNGSLQVDIHSTYFDNVGRTGTTLGALFISTDGWNPFGTAPYEKDKASNGEDWEYVIVMDNEGDSYADPNGAGSSAMLGTGGTAALFAVNQASIIMSSIVSGTFRKGQEVQYNYANERYLDLGKWWMTDVAGGTDVLSFAMGLNNELGKALFGQDKMAFHWGMSCANDVIEGEANVPEPATMALLGLGLLGIPLRRKNKA